MVLPDLSLSIRPPSTAKHSVNPPADLKKDLMFLILQFLDERKFKDTIHVLERESGIYFNIKYFEETITAGNWDEAEKYVSGFIKLDDSWHSTKIFFNIRWPKFFESILSNDKKKALDILNNDLKVFEVTYPELLKQTVQLLTMNNFRDYPQSYVVSEINSLRTKASIELKKEIDSHPLLRNKLHFPEFSSNRLYALLHQSSGTQSLLG